MFEIVLSLIFKMNMQLMLIDIYFDEIKTVNEIGEFFTQLNYDIQSYAKV